MVININEVRGKKIHEWLTEEMWTKGYNFRTADGVYFNNLNSAIGASYISKICKVCLLGALLCKHEDRTSEEYLKDERRISGRLNLINWPVDWNDAPERTFSDVITLLKELDI